jgi:hypothetical protein
LDTVNKEIHSFLFNLIQVMLLRSDPQQQQVGQIHELFFFFFFTFH